ncbi:hypothetical protein [Peptococcus simiae]|uniref:hypothetical protein n=1 Tax=Peptococcus simiae TaxID=1643805 RepID=UPI0039808B70
MAGLAFDVQCKSPSQAEALEACEKIADALDSQPGLIGCNTLEIYVEPHLAYRTDHEFVYSLIFYAEFLKG